MRAIILLLMLSLSGRAATGVFQGLLSQTLAPVVSSGTGNPPVNGYNYYWTVTVTGTMVSGTNSNYPVLVSADNTYLKSTSNGGQVTSTNGYDVAFFSNPALTSTLNYECESYSATSGSGNWWVKFPTIQSGSNTVFYMAWGNSSITGSTSSSGTATWDSNYVGVWHLGTSGTAVNCNDSTANGNNGTNNGATAVTGQIDGGAAVGSSNGYISTSNTISTSNCTVSVWVKLSAYPASGYGFLFGVAQGFVASTTFDKDLVVDSFGNPYFYAYNGGSVGIFTSVPGAPLSLSTWHHIVGVSNGSDYIMYVDGLQVGIVGAGSTYNGYSAAGVVFGGSCTSALVVFQPFASQQDEGRFSNIARSSNWIATEYNNQSNPSAFLTFGSEQ
jgi:biopolymer transport protein ExbB